MIGQALKFIRKAGRIIPIGLNRNATAGKIGMRALAGAGYGALVSHIASEKDSEKVADAIQKNRINSRAFVKRSGLQDVGVISNMRDLKKTGAGWLTRMALRHTVRDAKMGLNAAAIHLKGKDYVIAGKKINKSVLGHELGHIKDWRGMGRGKYNALYATGFLGGTYHLEKRAWDKAPKGSGSEGKAPALRTYKRHQDYSRIGALAGAATALLKFK